MMSFEICFLPKHTVSVALKPIAVQGTPSLSLSPSRKTCIGVHEERTHASLATKVEVFWVCRKKAAYLIYIRPYRFFHRLFGDLPAWSALWKCNDEYTKTQKLKDGPDKSKLRLFLLFQLPSILFSCPVYPCFWRTVTVWDCHRFSADLSLLWSACS